MKREKVISFFSLLVISSSAFSGPLTGWVRQFDSAQSDILRWSPDKFQNITVSDLDFLKSSAYLSSRFYRGINSQFHQLEFTGIVEPELAPELSANLEGKIKRIFSQKKRRCLTAGTPVGTVALEKLCCTGNAQKTPDGVLRCTLPDYANVSVYLDSRVSSEGDNIPAEAKSINGYLSGYACAKKLCASGYIATGAFWSNYQRNDWDITDYRVLSSDDYASPYSDLAKYFDRGAKWVEDLYCVPESDIEAAASIALQPYNRDFTECRGVDYDSLGM